jgi:hypothetical protein
MPVKERTPKERRHQLNQEQELSLHYGDLPGRPAFAGDEERQASWAHHRDRLLAEYRHARRPLAWWAFESSFHWPGREHERSTLYRAEVLSADERARVMAEWRVEFDKAQAPGFWLCQGPGRFLNGADARREHYRWADIPAELVERWSAEQLDETAAEPPAPAA